MPTQLGQAWLPQSHSGCCMAGGVMAASPRGRGPGCMCGLRAPCTGGSACAVPRQLSGSGNFPDSSQTCALDVDMAADPSLAAAWKTVLPLCSSCKERGVAAVTFGPKATSTAATAALQTGLRKPGSSGCCAGTACPPAGGGAPAPARPVWAPFYMFCSSIMAALHPLCLSAPIPAVWVHRLSS